MIRTVPPKTKSKIRLRVNEFPCRYCGVQANTWDHAMPRSRGGNNIYWEPDFHLVSLQAMIHNGEELVPNLFPCCSACNNDKGNMTHEEYLWLKSLRKMHNFVDHPETKAKLALEIDQHCIICKIRAMTDKINLMVESIERVKKKRASLEKITKDETYLERTQRPKVDELASNRLFLCVKALEIGISLGEIARIMGKEAHKNRLRQQLKRRGYKT